MNKTIKAVSKKIDESNKFVEKQVKELKDIVKNTQQVTSENIKAISKKQSQLEKNIVSIAANREKSKKFSGISLPKLPPLKTYKKSIPVNNKKSIAGKNNTIQNNTYATKQVQKEPEVKYEVETAEVTQDSMNYTTIDIQKNKKIKKDKLPTFTLMPGFVKGVLVNGGEVPAMLNGTSEPSPIFIRLTGDELIANDDSVNIDGCLILATAKGDLSKQAVDIRLSKISCNLTDLYGNKYKISQKIEGWVFGENGDYGVPGRLVSREGKIIKAGIPLTMVEAMINGLNNAISNRTYNGSII